MLFKTCKPWICWRERKLVFKWRSLSPPYESCVSPPGVSPSCLETTFLDDFDHENIWTSFISVYPASPHELFCEHWWTSSGINIYRQNHSKPATQPLKRIPILVGFSAPIWQSKWATTVRKRTWKKVHRRDVPGTI